MSLCVKYEMFEGPGGKGAGLPGGLIKPLLDNFDLEMHWTSLVFLTWVFSGSVCRAADQVHRWGMLFVSKSLKVPKP